MLVELYTDNCVWDNHIDMNFDLQEQLKKILKKKIKPDLTEVPDKLKCILESCFNVEPSRRPKANTFVDIFNTMKTDFLNPEKESDSDLSE